MHVGVAGKLVETNTTEESDTRKAALRGKLEEV